MALGAAALLAAGQPPRLLWPATLAGLALLLFACRDSRPRSAFWIGVAAGALACGLTVPWFARLFPVQVAGALFVIFALFFGLFAGAAAWIAPRIASPWLRAFWLAEWWIAVEFFRCEWFTLRFTWVTPGVALGPTWLAPAIGVYGQSFLAVLAAALLCERRTRTAGAAAVLAIALLAALRPAPVAPREPVRVALVQAEEGDFEAQLAWTRAATNAPQLVVWPEVAFFGDPRRELRSQLATLREHAGRSNVVFVVGCHTVFGAGESDWFNTALVFDGAGILGEHHKCRPVHLFNDGRPGTNAAAITTSLGAIGTPICFDCDYTEIPLRLARRGAEFFAVPSRDPSEWGDLMRRQHAEMFRLRAAECGRWFAVASAAGITQIVDPHGHVRASLPPYEPGLLCGEIGRETRRTFYVAAGWLLPWILSVSTLLDGLALLLFPRLGRIGGPDS